jgi:hypothetical protein
MLAAYSKKDKKALGKLIKAIPELIKLMAAYDKSLRRIWFKNNKSFGIEVLQIRNAGTARRFKEVELRLTEFIKGEVKAIPELDAVVEAMESMIGKSNSKAGDFTVYPLFYNYNTIATASSIL